MVLFHHQISTCRENVKCRKEKVDLLPGTSSGQQIILFTAWNSESSPSKMAAVAITHCMAFTHEIHMF